MSMMGELTFFFELQIKQSKEGIFINQTKYVKVMFKKFGIENAKEIGTPMSPIYKFDKDKNGKSINEKLYRGMIGSLLYLTASRPNILFSICMYAKFQSNPKESHMLVVKKIFRYLVNISNLRLWYSKLSSIDLIGYSDADYGEYKIDRKSTSGTC